VGSYSFESGFVGAVGRGVDRLQQTDPSEAGFRALAQDAYDSLLHMKPDTPLTHSMDAGHPAYAPDWNDDGVYGDPADYDLDVDAVPGAARFRYPCIGIDGSVQFERVGGGCGPDDGTEPLRAGVAREVRIVDARGFVLDATIWLPGEALITPCSSGPAAACAAPGNVRSGLPSVVFNNGLASRQDHYYWFASSMARAGYAVLTYDPAGQGESEGTMADLMDSRGRFLSGIDAQDATRWWVGDALEAMDVGQQRPFEGFHDPAYVDAGGDQVRNPYATALDLARVSMSGHSMGAQATVTYLNALAVGAGFDGRAVPGLAAAVPYSIPGETEVRAPVPMLMVSGDLDGIPLVAPAVAGQGWADDHERMYDTLRADPSSKAVGVVIIEGGVHTDQVDQPYIASTSWGLAVTERYTLAFLGCHVLGDGAACTAVGTTLPHLSRAFATQYDPDGHGPLDNLCVQAPDQASLGQDPNTFIAALSGQHAACDP
jgi:dienelactone hydrolase